MDWQTALAVAIALASAGLVARHVLRPFLRRRNRSTADDCSARSDARDQGELVQISPPDDSA